MASYGMNDVKNGMKILVNNQPAVIIDTEYVKPGKGQAFTRTKLKNTITGAVLEKTFKSGEKLEKADMEERQMQYLYPDGEQALWPRDDGEGEGDDELPSWSGEDDAASAILA